MKGSWRLLSLVGTLLLLVGQGAYAATGGLDLYLQSSALDDNADRRLNTVGVSVAGSLVLASIDESFAVAIGGLKTNRGAAINFFTCRTG